MLTTLKTSDLDGFVFRDICGWDLRVKTDPDMDVNGCFVWSTKTIRLNPNLKNQNLFEVVVHELMEAVNEQAELGLPHSRISQIADYWALAMRKNIDILTRLVRTCAHERIGDVNDSRIENNSDGDSLTTTTGDTLATEGCQ